MSKFFINRPIVAMVISILMTIVGLVAMSGLPIAQFPNIVPPEIKVSSTYTGADALTVEQAVATPIEQQMSGVDNMNYMYSINANNGQSTLTSTSIWGPTPTPTSCSPRCARDRPSRNCPRTCATTASPSPSRPRRR
jgi:multidrug efflux pump subunit AcrB